MIKKYPWAYALIMVIVIVAMDVIFFKHKFLERLIINILVVLLFVAVYLMFLRLKQ